MNEIVADQVRRFGLRPDQNRTYACGHAGMICDVRDRLERLGFDLKVEEHAAP